MENPIKVIQPDPEAPHHEGSILPLAYKDPKEDHYWICDYDGEDKITSMFFGEDERFIAYMPTEQDAIEQETLLKNAGWVKCKKPEINVKFDEKVLPRKVRRKMAREREAAEKKSRKS